MNEVEFLALKTQVHELNRRMKLVSDWHNTMDTPLWKKVWFWLQGYKWAVLGTWYTAPWNKASGEKYNGKLG